MNICALATGHGGAIAVIRISGPDAIDIVNKFFSKDISQAKGQSLHYGQFGEIDDVLLSIFRAPHSYTGEHTAEISCHASPYIIQQILHALCQSGCRLANPGEFTQRAFLNGKLDLSQAEAVADLISSTNAATHRMAMSQLKGNFSSELARLREKLLHLTTLMELELDFSDHEELEFADRTQIHDLALSIIAKIDRLSQSFRLGNAIKHGVPVAIVGAPNVGKSTLLNALLHDDRAIVSEIQGTTRDLIEDTMTLGGITFRFIDTAGIRHTDDAIEQLGIERSRKAAEKAHIVILLTEPDVDFPALDFRPDQTVIRIVNKTSDFQAINGVGLPELEQQLVEAVQMPDTDIVVTNARHYDALTSAKQSLQQVINGMQENIPTDLLAEDLRQVISSLGEITGGTITSQEVLNNIWSRFCIGK